MSNAIFCANRTLNGGRRLPAVKHECYAKISVKSFLKRTFLKFKFRELPLFTAVGWSCSRMKKNTPTENVPPSTS